MNKTIKIIIASVLFLVVLVIGICLLKEPNPEEYKPVDATLP